MSKRTTATLVAVCAALTACDSASTRDVTAPEPGAVRADAAALGTVRHPVVRPDGSVSYASAVGLRALVGAASAKPTVGTTTQCDEGEIVFDDDVPPGFFRPGGVMLSGTYDNIEVPPDKICLLDGATVIHNVTAFAGSRLFINTTTIGGNVLGLSPRVVNIGAESDVTGDVDVRNASEDTYPFVSCEVDNTAIHGNLSCTGTNGAVIIRGVAAGTGGDEPPPARPVTVDGSVTLDQNFIPPGNVLLLQLTTIGKNADVNKNTGAGGKSVDHNTVAQTLECKKNDPPFVGGPNVANKAKGQCF